MFADEYRYEFVIKLRKPIPAWNADNAFVRISSPGADGWRFRVSVIGSLEDSAVGKDSTQEPDGDAEIDARLAETGSWLKVELLSTESVSMGGELAFQPPGRAPSDPSGRDRHQTEHTWRFQRID
jgi:hypothetical protein